VILHLCLYSVVIKTGKIGSNIELYQNRGLGLSIDGFSILISKWRSSSVLTVPCSKLNYHEIRRKKHIE